MHSASASTWFRPALWPGRVWGRARGSMTGAAAWSAVLILLLTLMIARSTVTAGWVPGIDVVVPVALAGAVLMGLLAVLPVPWPLGVAVGLLPGPVVAAYAAWPQVHALHPGETLSAGLAGVWWSRLLNGSAAGDPSGYALAGDASFYLFLICLLMWVTGGWLSWCVLRWRRPLLGLVPGAAAFATNLLNWPNQNGYTLVILVLMLALLLWNNYTASIANVTRSRVKVTGDARWDFWESGLVAMAGLIALAILLPPLSTGDKTTEMTASAFSSWAALQERLNNGTTLRPGIGTGITGFSTDVALGGSLKKSHSIVFSYSWSGDSGPRYFRGVNITQTSDGLWRNVGTPHFLTRIPKDTVPLYAEQYDELALTKYSVNMQSAPSGVNSDILFFPGIFYKSDRVSMVTQVAFVTESEITTVDRLSSLSPPVSSGAYTMTSQYSIATRAELQQAGTNYPAWLAHYSSLPRTGYRDPIVLQAIHQLALNIVNQAGALTPYDKAKAIESYLRTNYTYKLDPPKTPEGQDPIGYFLFGSKQGYCEFFASAMGDLLRSLGIPTRLVNGFGPGLPDATTHSWIVRGEDAHTWVESYFPKYGWIQFEPTPDNVNFPIQPGPPSTHPCVTENQCTNPGGGQITDPSPEPSTTPVVKVPGAGNTPGGTSQGFTFRMPDAGTLTRIVGILLAIVLVLFAAAARYLRPRSVMLVWKRTLTLARLAGAERRPGETPLELGRRLASRFPEASDQVRSLADGFVVSAYAPPDLAPSARASVLEAWAALRPMLLRRVFSRLRLTRA